MTDRMRSSVILAVSALFLALTWMSADAQMKAGTVEVKRVIGQVEIQTKGQGPWNRATAGSRLSEGDHIRALAGGNADLEYPDRSTVLLAENSRLAITKLDYDASTRARNIASHLVVGKMRAQVSRAAIELVRARQANFHISTPVGVAAVRGTVVYIAFNPATNQVFVGASPSPGQPPIQATVTLIGFGPPGSPPVVVTISGGQFTTKVGDAPPSAPTPISSLGAAVQAGLQTGVNPATANNPNLTAPTSEVQVVTEQQIQVLVAVAPPPPPPPPPPPADEPPGPPAYNQ